VKTGSKNSFVNRLFAKIVLVTNLFFAKKAKMDIIP